MADYRSVHCRIWHDEWFSELDTDAKLLWLYLLTNQTTSVSGIYELPHRFIAFETGLSIERIEYILTTFKDADKIDFDDSVIWVKKFREYQGNSGSKVLKRIMLDFNAIPECRIKGIYAQKYGIDRVSIPNPESASDTDTDTDTEPIQKQKRKSADKPRTPPQIEAYRSAAHRYPNKSLYALICEHVKDDEASLELFKQIVTGWIAMGWNPANLNGILEFVDKGEIPHKNGQSTTGNGETKIQAAMRIAQERANDNAA